MEKSFTDLRINNTMEPEQSSSPHHSSHTAENNLNKRKASSKPYQHPSMNYGKHLDAWLDNSIKGLGISDDVGLDNYPNIIPGIFSMGNSLKVNSQTVESLSLPPQINYPDIPSSSLFFSPNHHPNQRNVNSNDNLDYASLPPRIFNNGKMMTQQHSANDLFNYSKVLSDPGINDSSDSESKNSCNKSKMNENNNDSNTPANADGNNNLIMMLLKEMNKLHDTNKKICRNLYETKVEMEALKHTPYWGVNHRRDSISGLSTSSQPVGMRYNLGMQSPAPTYHSQGNYTPGIVTDVVREVRELSRVREEALMDRVKTMIEERSWSLNEANFRLIKESDEMKKQVHVIKSDMNQIIERMLKLENDVLSLKSQLMHSNHVNYTHPDPNLPYANSSPYHGNKIKKNLHLNYGRINNEDDLYMNCYGDPLDATPNYSNTNNNRNFNDNGYSESNDRRYVQMNGGIMYNEDIQDDPNDQVLLLEKDTLKLRRELQDALASKQQSENRITALENMVTTLKEITPQPKRDSAKLQESYFRTKSPIQPTPISPNLQRAAQIQTISPKHVIVTQSTMNLTGPVTDL